MTANEAQGLIARAVVEFEMSGKNGSWSFQVAPIIEAVLETMLHSAQSECAAMYHKLQDVTISNAVLREKNERLRRALRVIESESYGSAIAEIARVALAEQVKL